MGIVDSVNGLCYYLHLGVETPIWIYLYGKVRNDWDNDEMIPRMGRQKEIKESWDKICAMVKHWVWCQEDVQSSPAIFIGFRYPCFDCFEESPTTVGRPYPIYYIAMFLTLAHMMREPGQPWRSNFPTIGLGEGYLPVPCSRWVVKTHKNLIRTNRIQL